MPNLKNVSLPAFSLIMFVPENFYHAGYLSPLSLGKKVIVIPLAHIQVHLKLSFGCWLPLDDPTLL